MTKKRRSKSNNTKVSLVNHILELKRFYKTTSFCGFICVHRGDRTTSCKRVKKDITKNNNNKKKIIELRKKHYHLKSEINFEVYFVSSFLTECIAKLFSLLNLFKLSLIFCRPFLIYTLSVDHFWCGGTKHRRWRMSVKCRRSKWVTHPQWHSQLSIHYFPGNHSLTKTP